MGWWSLRGTCPGRTARRIRMRSSCWGGRWGAGGRTCRQSGTWGGGGRGGGGGGGGGGAPLGAGGSLGGGGAGGARGPYFVPAFRGLVDLALETRAYRRMVEVLAPPGATLPPDSASEVAYLRGRVAYDERDLSGAATQFGLVERRSRLYPAAAYFRGLVAARQRQWGVARGAFCEIVDQHDKGKVAFAVDGRYFGLKELAQLALGRIAHEQGGYDEAYYFYFSVP